MVDHVNRLLSSRIDILIGAMPNQDTSSEEIVRWGQALASALVRRYGRVLARSRR